MQPTLTCINTKKAQLVPYLQNLAKQVLSTAPGGVGNSVQHDNTLAVTQSDSTSPGGAASTPTTTGSFPHSIQHDLQPASESHDSDIATHPSSTTCSSKPPTRSAINSSSDSLHNSRNPTFVGQMSTTENTSLNTSSNELATVETVGPLSKCNSTPDCASTSSPSLKTHPYCGPRLESHPGNESRAAGRISAAANHSSVAAGQSSTAAGHSSAASGHNSSAVGHNSTVTGHNSTSAGHNSTGGRTSDCGDKPLKHDTTTDGELHSQDIGYISDHEHDSASEPASASELPEIMATQETLPHSPIPTEESSQSFTTAQSEESPIVTPSTEESSPHDNVGQTMEESSPHDNVGQTMEESSPHDNVGQTMEESSPHDNVGQTMEESSPHTQCTEESSPYDNVRQSTKESSPNRNVRQSMEQSSPNHNVRQSMEQSSPNRNVRQSMEQSSPNCNVRQATEESSPTHNVRQSMEQSSPTHNVRQSMEQSSPTHNVRQSTDETSRNTQSTEERSPNSTSKPYIETMMTTVIPPLCYHKHTSPKEDPNLKISLPYHHPLHLHTRIIIYLYHSIILHVIVAIRC